MMWWPRSAPFFAAAGLVPALLVLCEACGSEWCYPRNWYYRLASLDVDESAADDTGLGQVLAGDWYRTAELIEQDDGEVLLRARTDGTITLQ